MQENKEVLISHIAESDKSNPKYDGGYKAELSNKTEFLHFLKKYVGAKWADGLTEDDVELCDKEFILEDFLRREADLLYRIHLKGKDMIDNILAIDKTRSDMDRFSQMLAQMKARMSDLSPQDRVSFSKWLEYVVLAVTEGENREKVHLLIEQLKGGEQGMMHGIQMLILAEKDAARQAGLQEGEQEGLQKGLQEGLQVGTRTREIDFAAKNIKKALKKGLSRNQVCEWVDLEPTDFERMYDALEADPEMSNDALFVLLSDGSQSL